MPQLDPADWLLVAWLALASLLLMLLVTQWLQGRRVRGLMAQVGILTARVERMQRDATTRLDWRDDDRLTKFNWRKPEAF